MTELYIDNCLCDLSRDLSRDFSVRLNRQLINPSELNTKDAQYSYSITLPATANNNEILSHANVEETTNKFNRTYRAQLIVSGVKVFTGNFRLSGVTCSSYKGNLYTPVKKSIKDIFGDKKLNENAARYVEFGEFAESVNRYNNQDFAPCIFPYTLYGLLPKHPTDTNTSLTTWDDTVKIGLQDFPPSVNVLQLLGHLFTSHGYKLSGSALFDERLTRLYMNYRNEAKYAQPWNWGHLGKIHISGTWKNLNGDQIERGVDEYSGDDGKVFTTNLLNCNFSNITIKNDPGANVQIDSYVDNNQREWKRLLITVPVPGFYKVEMSAGTKIDDGAMGLISDPITRLTVFKGGTGGSFLAARHGIKLLRDRCTGDFGLDTSEMDGQYYRDNLPQNDVYDSNNAPKYAPYIDLDGDTVLVDALQNNKYVAGFQWGKRTNKDINPTDTLGLCAQINAAKPAISWDGEIRKITRLAISSKGYRRWTKGGESQTPEWRATDKWAIPLMAAPYNFSIRGQYDSDAAVSKDFNARGAVHCVVWLEAGERLTVVDVSDASSGAWVAGHWPAKTTKFELKITPFRVDSEWLKLDNTGKYTGAMFWNDPVNFDVGGIDLVKFLPADIKTDDFIDNFCKAFNLSLTQASGDAFELNIKQSQTAAAAGTARIKLDGMTALNERVNAPLNLPSLYKLGFTVDTDEEGYFRTNDDGAGEIRTSAAEDKTIEQKSIFSFNWFKNITKKETGGDVVVPLAVISKREAWAGDTPYDEAMTKRYTNLALRFWYKSGLLIDLGFHLEFNKAPLLVAKVSNELPGRSELSYKKEGPTILNNFYSVFTDAGSHYTEVEGYLSPAQYEAINGSTAAEFNNDIYYVAEVVGYDPEGRNKTTIKLIKK